LIRRLRVAWAQPRRSLRPSRAGWLYIAITFGVGFAALNTGNNLLYLVLSLMLAFLVLSGFLSESALRGIRVERKLPHDIFAGRRNRVALQIRNDDRRLASFALVVEDRVRDGDDLGSAPVGRCFALRIAPGEMTTRDYALEPKHRGRLTFSGYRLSTRFPFGLFVKSVWIHEEKQAVVYPALEPVRRPPPRDGSTADGDDARSQRGDGVSLAGLRQYATGDGLRRINWRQSARRGALFVGEAEEEQVAEVEVELPRPPDTVGQDEGVFERQVVRAASEVVHHLDAGMRVSLRTPTGRFEADSGRRHRRALLRHLALVEPTGPPDAATTASAGGPPR
jgi:uncharacterized protein (DUF58 family)